MNTFFKVSGKKVELPKTESEWKFEARPGGWVIGERMTEKGIERARFAMFESAGKLSVSVGGHLYHGTVQVQVRGAAGGASDADLVAQFPGKVRKVIVKDGAEVSEGDPLVLVEAMKMEFSVKAPFDGKVVKVLVKEGQQLHPGDRFVDLLPAEPAAKGN